MFVQKVEIWKHRLTIIIIVHIATIRVTEFYCRDFYGIINQSHEFAKQKDKQLCLEWITNKYNKYTVVIFNY